jgi:methylenetetrahydrofolate dehydrogenase (NADP+)/methenyltetrahydrofolate cyclohydrolase
MILLDGKETAKTLQAQVAAQVATLPSKPHLVVVLVGDNPASQVYVKKKAQMAQKLGLSSDLMTYPADLPESELLAAIDQLNANPDVHAILVQMPLPKHMDTLKVLARVAPHKDVDGFHPVNLGRLLSGDPPVALPCTPAGMIHLLKAYDLPIAGQHAVVVGRSNIVGKPMALLLLQENATVTIAHSKTRDLPGLIETADILVAAIGQPHFIKRIKPGAVVLDVGINRLADGRLVGDVDFDAVAETAGAITPVPGGVGPMTIAQLMANTVALYQAQQTAVR